MYKFLLLFFLIPMVNYPQSIVWDANKQINTNPQSYRFSFIIDSKGNPVIVLDGIGDQSFKSYFIKFDSLGNNVSFKQYFVAHTLNPLNFYETLDGYRLFGVTDSSQYYGKSDNLLPVIINTNKQGDTTDLIYPYNIYESDNYDRFSTQVLPFNNFNCLNLNNNFINAYIKSSIPLGDDIFTKKDHLIIRSYDSSGKYLWSKGYDTLTSSVNQYKLLTFRISLRNTFLAIIQNSIRKSGSYVYQIKLIETDFEGNLLRDITYALDNQSVIPIDASGMEDGTVYILGYYLNTSEKKHFIIKYNSNNEIIKTLDLPQSGLFNHVKGMSLSPSGNIVLYGRSVINYNDPTTNFDDIFKMYMAKININLEFEWDYLWYENNFNNASSLMNAIFLDENTLLVVGYKDVFNIFCSKISLFPSEVKDNSVKNSELTISPNPARDYLEINGSIGACSNEASLIASEFAAESIQIFNTLGELVAQTSPSVINQSQTRTSDPLRIDVSTLAPGMYFIKIGNRVEKFVKM
jgi:hypothetical protein